MFSWRFSSGKTQTSVFFDDTHTHIYYIYCSLQVGCHSQWFMLDSVVSTVDTVWLTLAIHGFSALRNRCQVSLIAHALILVRYHKQARAVFTAVQWLCKIASNRSSLLIAMELELERMLSDSRDNDCIIQRSHVWLMLTTLYQPC